MWPGQARPWAPACRRPGGGFGVVLAEDVADPPGEERTRGSGAGSRAGLGRGVVSVWAAHRSIAGAVDRPSFVRVDSTLGAHHPAVMAVIQLFIPKLAVARRSLGPQLESALSVSGLGAFEQHAGVVVLAVGDQPRAPIRALIVIASSKCSAPCPIVGSWRRESRGSAPLSRARPPPMPLRSDARTVPAAGRGERPGRGRADARSPRRESRGRTATRCPAGARRSPRSASSSNARRASRSRPSSHSRGAGNRETTGSRGMRRRLHGRAPRSRRAGLARGGP